MAQNPWDNDPIINVRDATLDVEIDVTPLTDQERLALRPGQRVRLPDGRKTRITGQPSRTGQGEAVTPDLLVKETPWANDPVLSEGQLLAAERAEANVAGSGPTQAVMQGLTLGFSDELAGLAGRLGQQGRNVGRRLRGQDIEVTGVEYGDALQQATRDEQARFAREQPVGNIALQAGGGLLTGGLGAARAGLANAARVGAGYGAGAGFGMSEGGFADRLPGAALGGFAGGVVGAGAQSVLQAAAPVVGSIGQRITSIANPGGAARAATRRVGPEAGAAVRLASVIDEPAAVAERARLQGLGVNASVLDLLDNTGERMVRAAAGPQGPGADLAVRNARARTTDLRPEIMTTTRGLSPDPRTATEVRGALEETRGNLATEMYAPAYAARVPVTPEIISALSDAPGRAALNRARQAAVARRNTEQVAEIDDLIRSSREAEAARNIDRLPEGPLNVPDAPTPNQMQRFGRVERVPLSAARRTQNAMDWERFGRGESPGDVVAGYGDRPVAVRREDGQYLIYDGHHRATRAVQSGARDMEMYVIDAKDFAPDLAGRPQSAGPSRSEIDDLLRELGAEPSGTSAPSSPTVSAGTLDRIRIALGNRAEALGRNATGARDVAGGLRSRAGDIDAALADVPDLGPARAAYADLSGAMERIDNASGIFNTDPADFARQVADMTPTQREAAIIGLRQEILDTLGGQRAAGTGSLQNLAESNYARQNLATLLGPDEAARYIARIEAGVQQAQRANRVSPNTNSQTFGRAVDDETFNAANMVGATVDAGQALTGNLVAIGRTIDRLRSRATLSPEEREAIVRLGLGPAEDLERIVALAQQAQQSGRRSREVSAYLANARNVLGAQSPVTQQLERLLAPSLVAAEEESQ